MKQQLIIHGGKLSLDKIKTFLDGDVPVVLSRTSKRRLFTVRRFVEKKLKSNQPFYGINTGFGRLATERISAGDLERLQENLILSHAVGVGDPLPIPIARLIMLLRADVLAAGYSGVRPEVVLRLIDFLNHGITPVIPAQGSVGASGDLAPLAHVGLMLIGRGDVFLPGGKRVKARSAHRRLNLRPLKLAAKEGLSLVNGTQMMTAMAAIAIIKADNLMKAADIVGALSIEGDRASLKPFDSRIQSVRPHPGQVATAANIRKLTRGSQIIKGHADCHRIQDPYSFRCIPQVHGAVKDALTYVRRVVECELTSSTDNPLLFPEDDVIISGGNFHGQPIAIAMDTLSLALASLGSISERRVAILTAPLDGELPTAFLVPHAGLNSGMMIPHVTMSALVSENKILSHPASVDSIPTSGGQEDHVSMGPIASRKALAIITNVEKILAIELLAACQAIDLQRERQLPGKGTREALRRVRREVPLITKDREFQIDILHCCRLITSGEIVRVAEAASGKMQ